LDENCEQVFVDGFNAFATNMTISSDDDDYLIHCGAKYLVQQKLANLTEFSFNVNSWHVLSDDECNVYNKNKYKDLKTFKQRARSPKQRKCVEDAGYDKISLQIFYRAVSVGYQIDEKRKQTERQRFVNEMTQLYENYNSCMKPESQINCVGF